MARLAGRRDRRHVEIGHKGLLRACKTLAATMVDLYESPALVEEIRTEFKAKKGGVIYKPFVPDGPPPVPKD